MKRTRRRRSQLQEDLAALSTDRKCTRFLLDANSDVSAFTFLTDKGYDVMMISRPKLGDLDVWKIAKQTGRVLVTIDRDFWADRFTLNKSPGLAIVQHGTAEAIVDAVAFLKKWPTFWAGCKLWFVAEDRIRVKLRSHASGRVETITLLYRNMEWVEAPSPKRK